MRVATRGACDSATAACTLGAPTQPDAAEEVAAVAAPSPRGPPRLSVAVSVEGVDAKGALDVPVAAAAALSLLPADVAGETGIIAGPLAPRRCCN